MDFNVPSLDESGFQLGGRRDISGVHPLATLRTSALGSLDADNR